MFKGGQLPLYQAAHSKIEKWTKMKNNGEIIFLISYTFSILILFIYGYGFTDSPDEYYRLLVPAT